MFNKYGQNLGQKYPFFSTYYLFMLINLIFVEIVNSDDLRILIHYDSEIHLIIQGNGNQNILNNDFIYEPSEVIVNGYSNNSCKKKCYFLENINKTEFFFCLILSKISSIFYN